MALPPSTPQPTLAGYTNYIYSVAGVPLAWLPSDSVYITWSYNTALATVNLAFSCVPGPLYLQAVYSLAFHLLVCWQPDPSPFPGTPPTPYKTIDDVGLGYFQWLRQVNNVLGFVTGIVNSSGDEGTSVGLVVPKQAENLTLDQLSLTTTPWGRYYLGIAQKVGTNWGLT